MTRDIQWEREGAQFHAECVRFRRWCKIFIATWIVGFVAVSIMINLR